MADLHLSDGEWKLMKVLWQYSAAVAYAEVEPEETASFLTKVYGGSVGLMVSNLVGRGALSEQEIRELKAILDAAEQQED